MDKHLRRAVWLAAAFIPPAVTADEVTDQIHSAIEAYEQKDYRAAVDDLNYAIAQIQEFINSQNAQLLPEPLEGWTASEVENVSGAMAMLGGGTNMTRRYQREAEEIEINVIANSPWVSSMIQIIGNPMMMAGNPDLKPFRYEKLKGMKETTDGTVEVTLLLAGQVVIKITGQNLGDEGVIEEYLAAMDFDRLKATLL